MVHFQLLLQFVLQICDLLLLLANVGVQDRTHLLRVRQLLSNPGQLFCFVDILFALFFQQLLQLLVFKFNLIQLIYGLVESVTTDGRDGTPRGIRALQIPLTLGELCVPQV